MLTIDETKNKPEWHPVPTQVKTEDLVQTCAFLSRLIERLEQRSERQEALIENLTKKVNELSR